MGTPEFEKELRNAIAHATAIVEQSKANLIKHIEGATINQLANLSSRTTEIQHEVIRLVTLKQALNTFLNLK